MKKAIYGTLCALYIFGAGLLQAVAAAADQPPSPVPRPVPGGLQIEPSQRIRGRNMPWEHEIQIALPRSYGQGERRYPVLWVTDGSTNFDVAVETARRVARHVPEMIIVGVGVPPEAMSEFQNRRAYEFGSREPWGETSAPGRDIYLQSVRDLDDATSKAGFGKIVKSGGAADFLSFLIEEVRPALARQYRMSDTHILYGHSGGGTFCTFALMARPDSFAKYICSSAALYGGNTHLFELEKRYADAHADLQADVFFAAGEAEIVQHTIAGIGVVSSTVRMAEVLSERKYPSLRLSMRIFTAEDHGSVVPVDMYWGLRAVWSGSATVATGQGE